MEILRLGSEGEPVRRWQFFLIGQGLTVGPADGLFGPMTETATKAFQRRRHVSRDGVVGPKTYAAALGSGFDPGFTDPGGGSQGLDWPPKPIFSPVVSNGRRAELFGAFRYERKTPHEDDIRILDGWEREHIVRVTIPQLRGVKGAPQSGRIWVHTLVQEQTRALFDAWEQAGLSRLLLTWEGSFVPRFQRGSPNALSNHAWGTAFDVNYAWNKLGAIPAPVGARGSVRELVPLANQYGFYWGGHFRRCDGMHFEVARVLG
jgi:hypothetical protein